MPYDFTHMRRQKKKKKANEQTGETNKQSPHRYSEQLVVTRGKGGQGRGGRQMVKGVNCMVVGDN